MTVSKKNLILAGAMFREEAERFAHSFSVWTKMADLKEHYEAGDVSFSIAEMDSPSEEITAKYLNSVHAACRSLFLLDRKFYMREHLHIVCRLENLEEMVNALEEIESFLEA